MRIYGIIPEIMRNEMINKMLIVIAEPINGDYALRCYI